MRSDESAVIRESPSVAGAVLYGGRSTRMGVAKHLLPIGATTFIERVVAALADLDPVLLLGTAGVPAPLAHLPRLPDPPGVDGPLGAVVAALRHVPGRAVLVVACDQPLFTPAAVAWLLGQYAPGACAVLPRGRGGFVEPLGAIYGPGTLSLLERALAAGSRAPRCLEGQPGVLHPEIPAALASQWDNVNTDADLDRVRALVDGVRG